MPVTVLDSGLGPPPEEFLRELDALSDALDVAIPARQLDRNLLVATWNIREFGGFQPSWTTDPSRSPKRNFADLHYIAEVLSRFDIVAVQELQDDLSGLRQVLRVLGTDWGLLTSDLTRGSKGRERLGYVFDVRRVRPTGLVGELVLSAEDLEALFKTRAAEPVPQQETEAQRRAREARERDRQFGGQLDRTPYVASFTSAGRPFMLASVHLVWGDAKDLGNRAEEAGLLAMMLRDAVAPRGRPLDDFRTNLIALGDFNATASDDPILAALATYDMVTAEGLASARRTVTDIPAGPDGKVAPGDAIAYDQFAFFDPKVRKPSTPPPLALGRRKLSLERRHLDGRKRAMGAGARGQRQHKPAPVGAYDPTFRISDHFPLWLELSVRAV